MIKDRKIKYIEDEIKQANKLYLQHGFESTCIHAYSEFESLQAEMADLGIYLNFTSNKEHAPKVKWFSQIF